MKKLYIFGKDNITHHFLKKVCDRYNFAYLQKEELNFPNNYSDGDVLYIDGRYFFVSEIINFIEKNHENFFLLHQEILPFLIAENRINLKSFLANTKCKTVPSFLIKTADELKYYLPIFNYPVLFRPTNNLHIQKRTFISVSSMNDTKQIDKCITFLKSNPGLNYNFDEILSPSRYLNVNLIYTGSEIHVLPFIKAHYDDENDLVSAHPFKFSPDSKFISIINCIKNIVFILNAKNVYTFELLINHENKYFVSNFFPAFSIPGILHTHNMKYSQFDYFLANNGVLDLNNLRLKNDCMYVMTKNITKVTKQLQSLQTNYSLTYELVNLPNKSFLFIFFDEEEYKLRSIIESFY